MGIVSAAVAFTSSSPSLNATSCSSRTQYQWAKAWNKKRYRELGLDAADWSDTDKDEDSREDNAGFHDEDILPVGCWKGTEEDNASAAAEEQARQQCQHSLTHPTAKKASVNSEAEPLHKRRHRRIAEVDKIISRVRAGAETLQLILPDGESADLDRTVEELINVCIEHPHVLSVELQVSGTLRRLSSAKTEAVICQGTPLCVLGGGLAWPGAAVVRLLRAMRSGGRRLNFLGLTGTMLSDGDAGWLAGAIDSLPARDQAAEAGIIEILQVPLSEPVRRQLKTTGERNRIKVLLSRTNGPALGISS